MNDDFLRAQPCLPYDRPRTDCTLSDYEASSRRTLLRRNLWGALGRVEDWWQLPHRGAATAPTFPRILKVWHCTALTCLKHSPQLLYYQWLNHNLHPSSLSVSPPEWKDHSKEAERHQSKKRHRGGNLELPSPPRGPTARSSVEIKTQPKEKASDRGLPLHLYLLDTSPAIGNSCTSPKIASYWMFWTSDVVVESESLRGHEVDLAISILL